MGSAPAHYSSNPASTSHCVTCLRCRLLVKEVMIAAARLVRGFDEQMQVEAVT